MRSLGAHHDEVGLDRSCHIDDVVCRVLAGDEATNLALSQFFGERLRKSILESAPVQVCISRMLRVIDREQFECCSQAQGEPVCISHNLRGSRIETGGAQDILRRPRYIRRRSNRRTHSEYRTGSAARHALSFRAEEKALQAATAVRT